ncbi:uncharacterized protein B4U79_13735, partial [Dinothrombium tinctorium]
ADIKAAFLGLPASSGDILQKVDTSFSCVGRNYGYYADVLNQCKVFHVCVPKYDANHQEVVEHYSFVCPQFTQFDQKLLTCVDAKEAETLCEKSESYFISTVQRFAEKPLVEPSPVIIKPQAIAGQTIIYPTRLTPIQCPKEFYGTSQCYVKERCLVYERCPQTLPSVQEVVFETKPIFPKAVVVPEVSTPSTVLPKELPQISFPQEIVSEHKELIHPKVIHPAGKELHKETIISQQRPTLTTSEIVPTGEVFQQKIVQPTVVLPAGKGLHNKIPIFQQKTVLPIGENLSQQKKVEVKEQQVKQIGKGTLQTVEPILISQQIINQVPVQVTHEIPQQAVHVIVQESPIVQQKQVPLERKTLFESKIIEDGVDVIPEQKASVVNENKGTGNLKSSTLKGHTVGTVDESVKSLPPLSPEARILGLTSGADQVLNFKIDTTFSCQNKKYGYYADINNRCKVYHICNEVTYPSGVKYFEKTSFYCPLGTRFDQQKVSCVNEADAIECSHSEHYYDEASLKFAPRVKEVKQERIVIFDTPVISQQIANKI